MAHEGFIRRSLGFHVEFVLLPDFKAFLMLTLIFIMVVYLSGSISFVALAGRLAVLSEYRTVIGTELQIGGMP